MWHSCYLLRYSSTLVLFLALGGIQNAEASGFTFGVKGWYASMSVDNAEDGEEIFGPGGYLAWDITDSFWIAAAYIDGEVDTEIILPSGTILPVTIEEVDSDIIFGWRFREVGIDIGAGYRFTEYGTRVGQSSVDTSSTGPMVYLGGSDDFGPRGWGYYWGLAWMFEDMDDDDGSQTHFNGEAGFRWTSQTDFSILFGYRHKEYSGDFTGGLSFSGPAVNFAYTWR